MSNIPEENPAKRQDEFWMQAALRQADIAKAQGDVPVGCVVTCDNTLIATGFNEREYSNDPTAHAEIIAMRAASKKLGRWRLFDCTLYVTLEPCFMCAGAIVLARLPRVVFATDDPKAGAAGSLQNLLQDPRLNHRCEIHSGVLKETATRQLKEFFRVRRNAKSKTSIAL